MKILFLAPEPFFELRGTPINVRHMVESIGELGNHVHLLTYHIGRRVCLKNVRIYRIGVPFVRHVPIGPSYVKIPLDSMLFLKALKMVLLCRYDCIHAVEESVFIAFVLGKVFHIPYIYDMDSSMSDQLAYTGKLKNSLLLKLIKIMEKIVIRNSLAVLTVCSALTELVASTAPGKKIFQIEDCPVEFSERERGSRSSCAGRLIPAREELSVGKDSIIVMYVGNFEPYQGIRMLLESISLVLKDEKKVKLLLVGGEPEQIRELRGYAGQLGILDSVLFQGKKSFEEVPSYLKLADILVSPRLTGTNTPMKIFYYLASGKPIVATDLAMHNQVLSDKVAKLAEPDAQHFSHAIVALIGDKALRHKLGEEGKKLVESRYSASIFREKVKKVYEFASCGVHRQNRFSML